MQYLGQMQSGGYPMIDLLMLEKYFPGAAWKGELNLQTVWIGDSQFRWPG